MATAEVINMPNPAAMVPPESCMIAAEDLWKTYDMGSEQQVHALRGVNLRIQRNEYVAIMGPSGSGKSTLMNVLGCLDVPDGGTYELAGENVGKLSDDQLAAIRNKHIGFVFQTFNLLSRLNAVENVQLAERLAGKPGKTSHARDLLSEVGLGQRLNHLPRQLSGGEAQRVSIAVALANDPDLLLADELTGELDTATAAKVMDVLRGAWERRHLTILLVTHNRDLAAQADHRLRLLDGIVKAA